MDIDVDPVDGGPKPTATGTGMNDPMAQEQPPPPPPQLTLVSAAAAAASGSSAEEEARQAIEMLHGDDVGNRVAAAHRLESVAAALGPERTREVCIKMC
jgi:HPt (histidine-containing phosphotransfer) domain-containing protein